jgi:hypothetical protein
MLTLLYFDENLKGNFGFDYLSLLYVINFGLLH